MACRLPHGKAARSACNAHVLRRACAGHHSQILVDYFSVRSITKSVIHRFDIHPLHAAIPLTNLTPPLYRRALRASRRFRRASTRPRGCSSRPAPTWSARPDTTSRSSSSSRTWPGDAGIFTDHCMANTGVLEVLTTHVGADMCGVIQAQHGAH